MQNGWMIFSEYWRGLDYQTIYLLEEGDSENETHLKCEVHLLSCQLDAEADRA